jgi:hypothetical protein
MKTEKMKIVYRILFILMILFLFFTIKYNHCIRLRFSPIPSKIAQWKNENTVVVLSGFGLCSDCSPGRFLLKIHSKTDILYFVPSDFSDHDIENLKNVFMLNGKILKSDKAVQSYINKIVACNNIKKDKINLLVEFNEANRIKSVRWF